jgi:hypothetical protein
MIGYDKASAIAPKANDEGLTLKEAALQTSDIDDEVVDPGRWSGTGSAEVEGPTSVRVFIVMVGLTRMLYA